MADRKITDLTALTTPASADVLPIVDVSEAAAADKNKKITVGELFKGVPDGTAAAPAIAFESDDGNGIFLSTTDTVGIATNGSSRMTVSTTAVTSTLPVIVPDGTAAAPSVAFTGSGTDTGFYSDAANTLAASTGGTNALYIDSSQRVGIGSNTPSENLHVKVGSTDGIKIQSDSTSAGSYSQLSFLASTNDASDPNLAIRGYRGSDFNTNYLTFHVGGAAPGNEAMRLDGSARLLVGATSGRAVGTSSIQSVSQIETTSYFGLSVVNNTNDTGGGVFSLAKSRGTGAGSNTIVQDGDTLGEIRFAGANGSNIAGEFATVRAFVDGAPGVDDYPGRLVFSTTADGASSPTVRMTIKNDGKVGIGTVPSNTLHILQNGDNADNGISIQAESGDARRLYVGVDNSIGAGVINTDTHNLHLKAGGARQVQIYTNGSERVRVDSSGRLSVGTSSFTGNAHLAVRGDTGSETNGGRMAFVNSGTITAGSRLGLIEFGNQNGNTGVVIGAYGDGSWGANDFPGQLHFAVTRNNESSTTERVAIREDGIMHFFTDVNNFVLRSASSAGTTNYFIAALYNATGPQTGGTVSFRVWTNGNVINTNNSYGAISDIKLKENIVDASSQWDDLKAIQVRNYNFKEETGQQTHTQLGVVAQEIELVSPGLVTESPDLDADGNDLGTTTKSVNYSVLYMKAVKALQEAMERIETLEAKVAALEAS